jgi:hypothetical protein
MYIPAETVDDQFNEHCGVCDEQGIDEAVLADRDYEYDGKVIKISKKNFSKVHRDFKNSTKGKETMITYDSREGTVLVPVEFTEEVVEGWKKGKYTIKDENGKILGTYSSGSKAKKVMDDLMQKGDYPELTVSMVEEVEVDEANLNDYVAKFKQKMGKTTHQTMTDWVDGIGGLTKRETSTLKRTLKPFTEEVEVDESNELQAIMALDDVGIEATINKKDQVVVKKKDLKKAEAALKKSFKKGGAPELHGEEVEMEEAVNLKKLKKEYEKNEDDNYHRENYLLLAKAFGTKSEIKKVEEIMKRSEANNSTSQKDNDWMYKNIMPYYNKIRNEEVDMDEAKGTAYPATIDTLRKIVKDKQHQTVMFKSGQAIVDLFTASAMVQVYDALKKPEMKKTFEKMIGDKAGFLKTQAFAMKMLSGGK